GCSSVCAKTVTVNPLPSCSIMGPNTVCSSSTGNTYSGTAGANLSYAWQINGSGSINGASNAQNVSVNAGVSGSFTLTLTVTNTQTGCSSVCTKTVTIGYTATTTITAPDAVCALSTGNTASVPNAGQGATYNWTITNGTINSGQGTNSIIWTAGSTSPVTLNVQVSTAAGCPATGSKQVTVNPLPSCTITGGNAVCGASTNNTYSGPAGPNRSYAWQISGDGSINGANNAQNVSVNAGASGSFTLTLTVTDTQTGCSSVCAKTVTVNSLPSCSITGPNTVCSSSTGNTYSGPAGANLSYAWQISGSGSINGASNAQNVSVNAGVSGSFTLTLTVTNTQTGCSSVCTKTVTIGDTATTTITAPDAV